jgi:hypothetical protein
MISPSTSGIIVPPFIYGFPRHRSTISLLVPLIGDNKTGCFAWCMNTEFIVKLLINRGWLNIHNLTLELLLDQIMISKCARDTSFVDLYSINWGKQTLDMKRYEKEDGYVLHTFRFSAIPTQALAMPAGLFTVLCKNFDTFVVPLPQFIR